MKIIVVGAGIGGLSAGLALARKGHSVTIYESAPQLAEVGAGVQMSPNATKLFFSWGLGPDLLAKAALPQCLYVHNWEDGRVLGETRITRDFEERYGAPYIVVHRAELHEIIHRHAIRAGVTLHVASRVVEYDFEAGAITLASGRLVCADIVVAVDGINSSARRKFLAELDEGPQKTGWAAFRMMVDVEKIKANPQTAWITAKQDLHLWMGPNHSAMMYMVLGASTLNMVLSHPDDIDTTNWSSEMIHREIKHQFENWDPCLVALINMTKPNPANWPVLQVRPLPRLASASGKFLLMGDAAHAMAFYLSMGKLIAAAPTPTERRALHTCPQLLTSLLSGVSMAVEDAAALAECLSHVDEDSFIGTGTSLRTALDVYERTRQSRTKAIQEASLHAGDVLHLPDGIEQEARDAAMALDTDRGTVNASAYGLTDVRARDQWYGYDAVVAVREEWARIGGLIHG